MKKQETTYKNGDIVTYKGKMYRMKKRFVLTHCMKKCIIICLIVMAGWMAFTHYTVTQKVNEMKQDYYEYVDSLDSVYKQMKWDYLDSLNADLIDIDTIIVE